MKKFFTDILTGIDNATFDIGRVGMAIVLAVYCVIELIKVTVLHTFNEIDFSGGAMAILVGGAGGLALKHPTEPKGN